MPIDALTSAEISLPTRPDAARVRDRIAALATHVDLVGLTDNHAGQPRMSPLAAVALAREQGVATVVHVSCRDRNRLALRSQIVGAAALGSDGVLCLYGDPVPGVPRVKDYTTTKLLAEARGWAEPHDLALGCVADPFAADLEAELALLGRMVAYDDQALPGFSLPAAAYQQIAAGGGVDLATELAVTLAGVDGVDALHVMPLDEEAAGRVAAAFRAGRGAPVERVPRGRPQAP